MRCKTHGGQQVGSWALVGTARRGDKTAVRPYPQPVAALTRWSKSANPFLRSRAGSFGPPSPIPTLPPARLDPKGLDATSCKVPAIRGAQRGPRSPFPQLRASPAPTALLQALPLLEHQPRGCREGRRLSVGRTELTPRLCRRPSRSPPLGAQGQLLPGRDPRRKPVHPRGGLLVSPSGCGRSAGDLSAPHAESIRPRGSRPFIPGQGQGRKAGTWTKRPSKGRPSARPASPAPLGSAIGAGRLLPEGRRSRRTRGGGTILFLLYPKEEVLFSQVYLCHLSLVLTRLDTLFILHKAHRQEWHRELPRSTPRTGWEQPHRRHAAGCRTTRDPHAPTDDARHATHVSSAALMSPSCLGPRPGRVVPRGSAGVAWGPEGSLHGAAPGAGVRAPSWGAESP